VLLAISHDERLGEALGFVVAAARANRVYVAPVVFGLRVDQGIAVHFRGRSQEKARPLVLGQPQGLVGAQRADFQGLDGQLQVVNGTGRRRKVPHIIHPRIQEKKLGHVLLDELEAGISSQVRDVIHRAGDKIVNPDDLVSARQQPVCEVRPKEAGGAGDDRDRPGARERFAALFHNNLSAAVSGRLTWRPRRTARPAGCRRGS